MVTHTPNSDASERERLLDRLDYVADMGVPHGPLCRDVAAMLRANAETIRSLETELNMSHDVHRDSTAMIATLNEQLAARSAEVEALRKDAERLSLRLSLMIAHPTYLRTHQGKNGKLKWSFANPCTNYEYEVFDSAAEALDAALQEKSRDA